MAASQDSPDLSSLAYRYRLRGIHLDPSGVPASAIGVFDQVLAAITGFTRALDWIPTELRESPVHADWGLGYDVWMKVGSIRGAEYPGPPVAFGFTHWIGARPSLWFNPDVRFLASGDSLSQTAFEGAVHELGHVTEGRHGARPIIQAAIERVFGSAEKAAWFLSSYAVKDPSECWAEATVGTNTSAWSRFADPRSRDRLARLAAAVNGAADKPLI